jgi:hypothetical protein
MDATGTVAQITTLATNTAFSAWALANDFLIVLVLFILLFLFAQVMGRGPFVALLVSLYAGYAVYNVFPYTSFIPTEPPMTAFLANVALYSALTFVFFLILRRVIISDFLYIGVFGLAILSLMGAGFLVAVASQIFSLTSFYTLTPAIAELFVPSYFFWWFAGPAVGLLFLAR